MCIRDSLIAVPNDPSARQLAPSLGELDRLHSQAAASLDGILLDARPLPVAVLGHDEQVGVVRRDCRRDHLVVAAKPHAPNALGRPAHWPGLSLVEPDRLAAARDEQDVVVTGGMEDPDELVVRAQLDRDDAVRSKGSVVLGETRLLHDAPLRRQHEVLGFRKVPGREALRRTEVGMVLT